MAHSAGKALFSLQFGASILASRLQSHQNGLQEYTFLLKIMDDSNDSKLAESNSIASRKFTIEIDSFIQNWFVAFNLTSESLMCSSQKRENVFNVYQNSLKSEADVLGQNDKGSDVDDDEDVDEVDDDEPQLDWNVALQPAPSDNHSFNTLCGRAFNGLSKQMASLFLKELIDKNDDKDLAQDLSALAQVDNEEKVVHILNNLQQEISEMSDKVRTVLADKFAQQLANLRADIAKTEENFQIRLKKIEETKFYEKRSSNPSLLAQLSQLKEQYENNLNCLEHRKIIADIFKEMEWEYIHIGKSSNKSFHTSLFDWAFVQWFMINYFYFFSSNHFPLMFMVNLFNSRTEFSVSIRVLKWKMLARKWIVSDCLFAIPLHGQAPPPPRVIDDGARIHDH